MKYKSIFLRSSNDRALSFFLLVVECFTLEIISLFPTIAHTCEEFDIQDITQISAWFSFHITFGKIEEAQV